MDDIEMETDSQDLLDQLPEAVHQRIGALMSLHEQREQTMKQYFEERAKLEAKYQSLVKPLYQQRADIIAGKLDPETAGGESSGNEVAGIPQFWMLALTHSDAMAEMLSEDDLECLEALVDVQCSDDENGEGFTLSFHFQENEFFENTVLTKRYEVPNLLIGDEPILKKVIGDDIKWKQGKALTYREKTQKQRGKGKNSGQVRTVVKKEKTESFFHFFTPPKLPSLDKMTEADAERLESEFNTDYEIAQAFRTKIIPDAVLWYQGQGTEQEMEAAMEGLNLE